MKNWFKAIIVIGFVFVIGISSYLFLIAPSSRHAEERVTSNVWVTSTWKMENTSSIATFENDVFSATANQSATNFFGASLIQQGDNPHGQWNLTASNPAAALKKDITISRNEGQQLILSFSGKRTSQIEWFSDNQSSRGSNIGILLVGDIGRDYYNPDTSQPRALLIDIWLDTNPEVKAPNHWQGIPNVENDYHSGFPVKTMPEVGKEYEFNFRIDTFIRDALIRWNLESFTLKMVQCYVEARASNASIEVNRIFITT